MQITYSILTALALVLFSGAFLWLRHEKRRDGDAATADLRAVARIKDTLRAAAASVVTRMELTWGGGSGPVKLSGAILELLKLVPEKYKGLFDVGAVIDIIEDTFTVTRGLWGTINFIDDTPAQFVAKTNISAGQLVELAAVLVPAEKEYTADILQDGKRFFATVHGKDSMDAGLNAEILYPGADIGIVDDDTSVADRAGLS